MHIKHIRKDFSTGYIGPRNLERQQAIWQPLANCGLASASASLTFDLPRVCGDLREATRMEVLTR
jgi:hypothetical protein